MEKRYIIFPSLPTQVDENKVHLETTNPSQKVTMPRHSGRISWNPVPMIWIVKPTSWLGTQVTMIRWPLNRKWVGLKGIFDSKPSTR